MDAGSRLQRHTANDSPPHRRHRDADVKKRGEARATNVKATPEMEAALADYLKDKPAIKRFVALKHDAMLNAPYGAMQDRPMQLLEQAAHHYLPCMDLRLVNKMARLCAHAVAAAKRNELMQYGT